MSTAILRVNNSSITGSLCIFVDLQQLDVHQFEPKRPRAVDDAMECGLVRKLSSKGRKPGINRKVKIFECAAHALARFPFESDRIGR